MSTSRVFTVGQVLTAAQMNDLPQGVLTKASATAAVGPTSGTTELDVIVASAVTIAGTTRRLRISFHCLGINNTVNTDTFRLRIKEGATELNGAQFLANNSTDVWGAGLQAIVDSPSAASHTYKVTIQRQVGTGTATVDASSTDPITLTVEDV